jgi:signal transduction histidine kinase/ligand-binding sensor domain-containing protein
MFVRRWVLSPLLLFIVQAGAQASAETVGSSIEARSYTLTAWTGYEGLQLGDVFAIAEDRDGYLWLGTSNGLVRFDGAVFTRRESVTASRPAGARSVSALLGARDGSLWIGYGGADGLARMRHGELAHFTAGRDLVPESVAALFEDRAGTIWAGGRGGLSAFRQGRWERIVNAPGLREATLYSIYEDRNGQLWLGTSNGVYARTVDGFELRRPESTFVQDFAEDRHGAMWITDTRQTIRRLDTGAGPKHGAGALVPEGGWRMASDRDGTLWVAALGGGLLRLVDHASGTAALERFPYEHKISGSPRSIFADRNGNLWVGLRAGGLLRVSENSIRNQLPLEGLTNDGVRALRAAPDGSVWVATGHSLNRFIGTRTEVYALPQARALDVDGSGQLWIAAVHGFGRFEKGRFAGIALPSDIRWQEIMSVASDRAGGHWFCSSQQGVAIWRDGALERFPRVPRTTEACSSIFTDGRGRTWVGFTGGGVAVFEAGSFHHLGEAHGLARGAVLQVLEDRANSIWVETGSGISRFQDGRFTTVTQRNGPFTDLTAAFVQDDEGYLWVGVNGGAALVRFSPTEMDRVAADPLYEIRYALYDASDGLQGEIARQQGRALAARDENGRLWFASGTTLVMLDPRQLPRSQQPVAPRIDAVSVDGMRITPGESVRLPAGVRNLAIDWIASSLNAASKLRFRHRLEGHDPEWIHAGSRRNVSYAQLPSGSYRFRVSATYDGVWTDGEAWEFTVASPFYLSGWFLSLSALMLIALVTGAWWLRIRAVQQRYALVFAERALVSREIHDTLLQNFAAIGIELEAVLRQLDPGAFGVDALRRLQHQAAHSLKDARDLVVALRRTGLSQAPGLVEALRGIAAHTTAARATRVSLTVAGAARRCSADVELQLLRICQEAINNSIVHGGASAIELAVTFTAEEVTLRVSDNGRGFAADAEPADGQEHLGLLGMQERAERIRARLSIRSTPGAGTIVEVTGPVDGR